MSVAGHGCFRAFVGDGFCWYQAAKSCLCRERVGCLELRPEPTHQPARPLPHGDVCSMQPAFREPVPWRVRHSSRRASKDCRIQFVMQQPQDADQPGFIDVAVFVGGEDFA